MSGSPATSPGRSSVVLFRYAAPPSRREASPRAAADGERRNRRRERTTSAEPIGVPSWNTDPARSRSVHSRPFAASFQDLASAGFGATSPTSIRRSCTSAAMRRAPAPCAGAGSKRTGSSASATVTRPPYTGPSAPMPAAASAQTRTTAAARLRPVTLDLHQDQAVGAAKGDAGGDEGPIAAGAGAEGGDAAPPPGSWRRPRAHHRSRSGRAMRRWRPGAPRRTRSRRRSRERPRPSPRAWRSIPPRAIPRRPSGAIAHASLARAGAQMGAAAEAGHGDVDQVRPGTEPRALRRPGPGKGGRALDLLEPPAVRREEDRALRQVRAHPEGRLAGRDDDDSRRGAHDQGHVEGAMIEPEEGLGFPAVKGHAVFQQEDQAIVVDKRDVQHARADRGADVSGDDRDRSPGRPGQGGQLQQVRIDFGRHREHVHERAARLGGDASQRAAPASPIGRARTTGGRGARSARRRPAHGAARR